MRGPVLRGLAFVASVLALMLTAAAPCWAGDVEGNVTVVGGGIAPAVEITLTSSDGSVVRTAFSDARGNYRINNMPEGDHLVTGTLSGFFTPPRPLHIGAGNGLVIHDIVLALGDAADHAGTTTVVAGGTITSFTDKWSSTAVRTSGLPGPPLDFVDHGFYIAFSGRGNGSTPTSSSSTLPFVNPGQINEFAATVAIHEARFLIDGVEPRPFADFRKVIGRVGAGGLPGDLTDHVVVQFETVHEPLYGNDKRVTMSRCRNVICTDTETMDRRYFPGRKVGLSLLSSQDSIVETFGGQLAVSTTRQYAGQPPSPTETIILSLPSNLQRPSSEFFAVGVTLSLPADLNASGSIAVSFSGLTINGEKMDLARTSGAQISVSPGSNNPLDRSAVVAIATGHWGLTAPVPVIKVVVNGNTVSQGVPLRLQATGVATLHVPDVDLALGSAADIGIELTAAGTHDSVTNIYRRLGAP